MQERQIYEIVEKFIIENRVSCPEATCNDSVYENAPDFVNSLCQVVGYADYDTKTLKPLE